MDKQYRPLLDQFLSSMGDEEIKNLKLYHQYYQNLEDNFHQKLEDKLKDHPVFGKILAGQSEEEKIANRKASLEFQHDAIMNNNWEGFIDYQIKQGTAYAKMGVEFYAWYDVVAMARDFFMQDLMNSDNKSLKEGLRILRGMNRFFDMAMSIIGEAYLSEKKELIETKESTITQQARDILELSTPVISIWDGIVMAPLIGSLDSERTHQFKEVLLNRIVETGSPVALVDITGVPTIDTQTAQHLIETVKGVRLLGADVVLTGVRPSIAQTLVHLGITLPDITSCSSLVEGLKIAFNKLDLQVKSPNGSQTNGS